MLKSARIGHTAAERDRHRTTHSCHVVRAALPLWTAMGLTLSQLQELVQRLDPFKPLEAGSELYVPLDEDGARCERSCTEQLRRTILVNAEPTCQLFTGFPGSGKTTELKRLAAQLENEHDAPTTVVFVPAHEYFDQHSPIAIADVLRVLAYCLDREATRAEGKDPDTEPGYLQRLWDYLTTTDVELREIGFDAYGANLMLELKQNPQFAKRAADAIKGRFQKFASEAHDTMAEAVDRLGRAPRIAAQRVVVIVDGLERLSPINESERPQLEHSVERLFVSYQDLLRIPCHVIYTFPLWLRFRTAQLGAIYGREPLVLPMVKVSEQDGDPYRAGLAKLERIVGKRFGDHYTEVFGPQPQSILLPLIEASGGYPRDLLRMVRSLVMDADLPVSSVDAERVILNLAATYSDTILDSYVDLLVTVGRTHALPRRDEEQRALFGHLFEHWLILAYRNGGEWYDLHPLVRRDPLIDKRLKAG